MLELSPEPPELNFWTGCRRIQGVNSEKREGLRERRPDILILQSSPADTHEKFGTTKYSSIRESLLWAKMAPIGKTYFYQ